MRLEAGTIGPDVPPGPCSVTIHSVFPGAVNLQPGGAGMLVTLLGRDGPERPQGIRLAGNEDFTAHGLRPGCGGRIARTGITLDRPGASPLHVSFARATRAPALPLPSIPRAADWRAAVDPLAALQAQTDAGLRIGHLLGPDPAPDLPGRRLAAAALALGGSVRSGSPDAARAALASLVGLGPGLTPSGDDLLCGFLVAGHCRSLGCPEPIPFLAELAPLVLERLSGTNAISATFLRCAAEGKTGGELRGLARALRDGTGSGDALAGLAAFGHSSGLDLATGFLYGLSVWE